MRESTFEGTDVDENLAGRMYSKRRYALRSEFAALERL